MTSVPRRISLAEWEVRHAELRTQGIQEPEYGGPLGRHCQDGDLRLQRLQYDNSTAALRLWNFLLTEEDRLRKARKQGKTIVGAMKDLGTVPVLAFSFPDVVAFYPDGAWWIPCLTELTDGLLDRATAVGIGESFCPVRAMLGAFLAGDRFPIPDLLTCSVGATCDDFSAITQRLESLGHPVLWWEVPHRRSPCQGIVPLQMVDGRPDADGVELPGGFRAAREQVQWVQSELERIGQAIAHVAGTQLDEDALREGIEEANRIRRVLARLRRLAYTAPVCPLPALEMLIAEMLAIHFCSDRTECLAVLQELLEEVERRVKSRSGPLPTDAIRVFWVNPVADLRVMNLLEDLGGRICGTEYLIRHALGEIPLDCPPWEALARTVLADPMVGPVEHRAEHIRRDLTASGAQALIISRIPGASHCALEGSLIRRIVHERLDIPLLEIEVPPVCDAMIPGIRTRIEALLETVRSRK